MEQDGDRGCEALKGELAQKEVCAEKLCRAKYAPPDAAQHVILEVSHFAPAKCGLCPGRTTGGHVRR
jgi:hypothetical protein